MFSLESVEVNSPGIDSVAAQETKSHLQVDFRTRLPGVGSMDGAYAKTVRGTKSSAAIPSIGGVLCSL